MLAAIFLLPATAYAYDFVTPSDPINVCENDGYSGLTKRIVMCMQDTILSAVNGILAAAFSQFFGVLAACMTLATAFWGFQMATGRSRMALRDGGVLLIKMAVLVLLFGTTAYSYQELFGKMLDIMGELIGMVSGYVDFSNAYMATCDLPSSDPMLIVWDRVDCALDILIGGLIPNSTIKLGITAFILAAMVTNAIGFFVGLLILFMIIQVVFAVARAVYIYILSYFALSMMALVAPIFLPMVLFNFTRGYFEKWLRLTFGYILQPIFIFAYLAMLLAAFDTVVYSGQYSLYNKVVDSEFSPWLPMYSVGEYLIDEGVYVEGGKGNAAVNYNVKHASNTATTTGSGGGSTLSFANQETGMAGDVGKIRTTQSQWDQLAGAAGAGGITNIYQLIGRGGSNPDGINPYFFHLKVPTRQVDWNKLANLNNGCPYPSLTNPTNGEACRTTYFIELILAAAMAMVMAYIFMQLLNALPFIGSGIAADAASSSGFGFGSMAPPGESMITGLKNKLAGGT